jgi:hypothetical protein
MLDDRFTLLLKDLSTLLKIELKPDQNNSCLINLKDKIKIQLELDPAKEAHLVIGSILGELHPGKFREELLMLALQANGKLYPRAGNFAYSTKLNSLILFEILNLDHYKPDRVLAILTPFVHKAFAWKDSISKGTIFPHLVDIDFIQSQNQDIFNLNG